MGRRFPCRLPPAIGLRTDDTAFCSLRRSGALARICASPVCGLNRRSNFALDVAELSENRISLGHARSEVHINDVVVSVFASNFNVANETSTTCDEFKIHRIESITGPKYKEHGHFKKMLAGVNKILLLGNNEIGSKHQQRRTRQICARKHAEVNSAS